METNETETQLSFGEKMVGLKFNPGGDSVVNDIKTLYARVIDYCNSRRATAESPEVKRQYSVAITEAMTSQMWAVKAATWKD